MVKVATPVGAWVLGSTAAWRVWVPANPDGRPLPLRVTLPVGAATGTAATKPLLVTKELIVPFSTSTLRTVGWFCAPITVKEVLEMRLEAPTEIDGVSFITVKAIAEAEEVL